MKKLLLAVAVVAAVVSGVFGVTKDDYAMKFTVTVADGVGDKTAENAVIPIRLSESAINGFKYSDFNETDGTDLYIVDGSDTRLDYEIDMWNPSGETTVWVKVPAIAARTVLTVYYKGVKNTDNVPNNVWSLFLGVWHLNDDSVKVDGERTQSLDSSGNGLHATNTAMTASVDGRFGKARQPRTSNYNNSGVGGVFLPYVKLPEGYVLSGQFKVSSFYNVVMFSTKERMSDTSEKGMRLGFRMNWNNGAINLAGDEQDWAGINNAAGTVTEWNRNTFVVNDGQIQYYRNGAYIGKNSATVTDTGKQICVGNASSADAYDDHGEDYSWIGQFDEIRIQAFANFDASREFYESAIAYDDTLTVYSPAASCDNLAVGLSFEVVTRMVPGEIEFTATVDGATGECSYSWDFNNDGTIDRVGTSATETWECTTPGKYNAKVSVVDSIGVAGEITTLDTYIINGIFYADGDAEEDGDGSQESPYNSLRTLSTRMNDGDQARIRGTFVVGDESDSIAFEAADILLDKWGEEKPLIKSETTTFTATSGIFVFNGANTVVSNLVFNMTKESFQTANIVRFNGNNATLGQCDFSVVGGKCDSVWGYAGGVGTHDSQRGLLIADCTFKGFRAGNTEVYPLLICEDATVVRCLFEDISCAIRAHNGKGGNFNFVSNVVLNAESESIAGSTAGVVIKGGWGYFSGSTIAYNRFINTNEAQKAGCVIICPSKTGQNGINAHHNTVIGYKTFAVFDSSTQEPWTFTFFDNLVLGCDYFFKDEKVAATYATQKDGCIRNNYHTGVFCDVPDGYTFNARMVVDGNVVYAEQPKFQNTTDATHPGYYRLRIEDKTDPLIIGGWTDSGKYPAYIGAVEPYVPASGLLILVR